MQARVQAMVQLKDSNLLTNESKLVPRNLDLGAHLKWALLIIRVILDAGPRYKVQ